MLISSPAGAARVLIVGDLQYPFVANVAAGIRSVLKTTISEYPVATIRGRLTGIAGQERAQVVVALGSAALAEAMQLPAEIPIVYGLVASPPQSSRHNMTGVYMAPPAGEYIDILRRHIPSIGKISIIGSPATLRFLASGGHTQVITHQVDSSVELVSTVNRLSDSGALLLLPDTNLLTSSAMESIFAFSIPLLGISEGNVRQGSLMSLVFEPRATSWQIGEKVQSILNGNDAGDMPPSAPQKYNMFINTATARKMGINIPGDLLRQAKKVYP